jgi:Ca-activated chloride channel family protein
MIKHIVGIQFAAFQYIFYLPLLICLMGIVYWRIQKKRKAWQVLSYVKNVQFNSTHLFLKNYVKETSFIIACFSLFIALLRPQWGEYTTQVTQEGRDILFALDVSRSMLAQDCTPDRLSCAKKAINHLLINLPAERVGLMVFAGLGIVQCPLTTDYSAFKLFLDQIDEQTISQGTTALDQAINKALDIFGRNEQRQSKILVLLTDGEDFSRSLATVKQRAQEQRLALVVIGVGTEAGAPVPLINHKGGRVGYQKDAQGAVVISKLNRGILENLTQTLGGCYVQLDEHTKGLSEAITFVQRFAREKFADTDLKQDKDQYPWFVGIGILGLMINWLL